MAEGGAQVILSVAVCTGRTAKKEKALNPFILSWGVEKIERHDAINSLCLNFKYYLSCIRCQEVHKCCSQSSMPCSSCDKSSELSVFE